MHFSPSGRFQALSRYAGFAVTLGLAATAVASTVPPAIAVFSKTSNGYVRTMQADNTYKPETYAFAAGGRLDGRYSDDSMDNLKFAQIAGVVAASLKRQNYLATTDPKTANLMIFVYWGATTGWVDGGDGSGNLGPAYAAMNNPAQMSAGGGGVVGGVNTQRIVNDAAAQQFDMALDRIMFDNEVRERANRYNASILGYDVARRETNFLRPYNITARDILAEVEDSRYFVVLNAYDFQRLRNHQGKVLLWELRYSIQKDGNRFDEQLVSMTRYASQFSGQNLNRLVRQNIPSGKVEMGTPVVVPEGK